MLGNSAALSLILSLPFWCNKKRFSVKVLRDESAELFDSRQHYQISSHLELAKYLFTSQNERDALKRGKLITIDEEFMLLLREREIGIEDYYREPRICGIVFGGNKVNLAYAIAFLTISLISIYLAIKNMNDLSLT